MKAFRTPVVLAAWLAAASALANTYTVTSTADSGAGSLRQAILDANTNPGADTIEFNIVGSGVQTIAPASALPAITDGVTIDGYTQPGSSPNTHAVGEGLDTVLKIEIDGTAAGPNGLVVQAQDVTIRGLAINRFPGYQIEASGYPYNTANLVVEGCFLGTTPDGLHASGTGAGVAATHLNFRIGGLTPAARNLIATEVHLTGAGVAQGNLIGTDATGLRAAAPGAPSGRGVYLYGGNAVTFGGTDPNAGNVVAGFDEGLRLESATSTVQGNYFGVDAGLTGVIPSGSTGIAVVSAGLIGGAGPGEGNIIGGWETGVQIGHPVTFQGNAVGTDFSGTRNLGNRINGVYVASSILSIGGINPGEANLIAFNGWAGVLVYSFSKRVTIRGNRIFENGFGGTPAGGFQGIGIDLASAVGPDGATANDPGDGDSGTGAANDFQNFPLITSAAPESGGTRVIGTLNSLPSAVFDLDFYGNPACRRGRERYSRGRPTSERPRSRRTRPATPLSTSSCRFRSRPERPSRRRPRIRPGIRRSSGTRSSFETFPASGDRETARRSICSASSSSRGRRSPSVGPPSRESSRPRRRSGSSSARPSRPGPSTTSC